MKYEDIIKVRVGTILRDTNNNRFLVIGADNDIKDIKVGILVLQFKDNSNTNFYAYNESVTLDKFNAIIEKQLSSSELLKYTLLGLKFYENKDFSKDFIDISTLTNTKCIRVYDEIKDIIIQKEFNKYYMYDVVKYPYVTNKRVLKNCPKYIVGNIISSVKLRYEKSKLVSTSSVIGTESWMENTFNYFQNVVRNVKNLGTKYDLSYLLLYKEKREILYKKITKIVFRKANIQEEYKILDYPTRMKTIRYETDYHYTKYFKILKPIIDKIYNYILNNINIDANKKLSTIAKEKILEGKNINGYDSSIDIEEFFDTNKYYPWEIMDWVYYADSRINK